MKRFEWDEKKAESNFRKHGITFEKATEAFYDPLSKRVKDSTTDNEERWILIGMTRDNCLLMVVVHTIRGKDEIIRIISARQAERKERRKYEHG